METIAFLLLVLFIGIAIMVNAFYRRGKQHDEERSYVMEDLGFNDEAKESLLPLMEHLTSALDQNYVEQLQNRVIKEHQISPIEWENRWFEWRRFLIMVAMFENVPMYSREVDEIWHEMLMFTREYEQFSQQYLKSTLHHAPNTTVGEGFNRHERATFDWLYVTLFKPTPYSHRSWGNLLKHPLKRDELQTLHKQKFQPIFHQQVIQKVPVVKEATIWFANYVEAQLQQMEHHINEHGRDLNTYVENFITPIARDHPGLAMLQMNLFLSNYYADDFDAKREKLFKQVGKELRKQKKQTEQEIKAG